MSKITYAIIDVFCVPGKVFSGNPAAVCLLEYDDEISDETKTYIGCELNLSDTAFVSKSWSKTTSQQVENHYTLRWYSPTKEVALCGHATIATAEVLFSKMERGSTKVTTIHFETKCKGNLSATMNWDTGRISINFPLTRVTPISELEMKFVPNLLQHLIQPFDKTFIHSVHYAKSTKYLFVRLHDRRGEKGLTDLKPDFYNLSALQGNDVIVTGAIVTVRGVGDIHFYSRFFAPWMGVNEDPVCGSAHCALTAYWSNILNQKKLLGKQCSKRGGYIYCSLSDSDPERVILEGNTKIFAKGELSL